MMKLTGYEPASDVFVDVSQIVAIDSRFPGFGRVKKTRIVLASGAEVVVTETPEKVMELSEGSNK